MPPPPSPGIMLTHDCDYSELWFDFSVDSSKAALRCVSQVFWRWGKKKVCVCLWVLKVCLTDWGFTLTRPLAQLEHSLQGVSFAGISFVSDLSLALLGGIDEVRRSRRRCDRALPHWQLSRVSYTAGILWNSLELLEHSLELLENEWREARQARFAHIGGVPHDFFLWPDWARPR